MLLPVVVFMTSTVEVTLPLVRLFWDVYDEKLPLFADN